MALDLSLSNLDHLFPEDFTKDQISKGQTLFLKKLSELSHRFYGGKMRTVPKAAVFGFNWFNVYYTPGVSLISTTIRDNNDASFELSNRANFVAVVSDSTRVLGDGDVTPAGGLGVMEGKAFLMNYLGGLDAVALCIDSRDSTGKHNPDKIIDFVRMVQHSFGAVNLEDISQPNCYKVLDVLRDDCTIPVWHDDAQGTGCVTLAGLVNALKVAGKDISTVRIVFNGAGASNTTIARLIIQAGADPSRMIMFDTKGGLHTGREDIKSDRAFYRKWEICEQTNPDHVQSIETAMKGADVLISLSQPGPDVVKPAWIKSMADKSIVFVCANPVPEIYPFAAKEAGAYIVATGRGDFPNQVNNSLGFPGILKGATMVRASKITDNMAIAAAYSLASYAEKNGIHPEYIIPTMDEATVFPQEAADVAMQAIKEGVARKHLSFQESFDKAKTDIEANRSLLHHLVDHSFISKPPESMIKEALEYAVSHIRS